MILSRGKETVLVIPDIQAPFQHKHTLDFLVALRDAVNPTKVVCIGDSMDANALSRWALDPNGMSPLDEYLVAIDFLKKLYDEFPKAQEVISNHNERIIKRVTGAGVPSIFVRSYEEIMHYPPGWSIHPYIEIDEVIYEHGHSQGGEHAAKNLAKHNGKSTVIGHHHSAAGINFFANRQKMLFGMNVGCLLDISSYAFSYAKDSKFKPTMGAGIVDRGVPKFVPMLQDSYGNWTGELIL